MANTPALFHQGEIAIHQKLGISDSVERLGRMMVRDHMPGQHQHFYENLPMLFVGYSDENENVWASVLTSQLNSLQSTFISANSAKSLSVKTRPFIGDPLQRFIKQREPVDRKPMRMGVLGIELETRRRNRMSASVGKTSEDGFELDVLQTFGNCPQYIQRRKIVPNAEVVEQQQVIEISEFDDQIQSFIQEADTFFVASSSQTNDTDLNDVSQGADVSHRGGRPGFIKVNDEKTLTIPDFIGNNHFNTLGNFMVNPSAGLLFIDFVTGDVLMFTGKAEILWDDNETTHFKGAQRFWQFRLQKGFVLKAAMPWRFEFEEYSPNSQMTGTWAEAESVKAEYDNNSNNQQLNWQTVKVSKVVKESQSISSFYLKTNSKINPQFKPGQFLSVKVLIDEKSHIRNYSLSSSPLDNFIRISVKKDGLVSSWLHENLKAGKVLDVKLPMGNFQLSEENDRPAILLSAGVGITPMVSMFRYLVQEGIRTRNRRPVLMFNTFRKFNDMVFFEELNELSEAAMGSANAHWLLTQPEPDKKPGVHFSAKGRLTQQILQSALPLGRYDFYLCGPTAFMQNTYEQLISLGVRDKDIKAEAFGPATLKRQINNRTKTAHAKNQSIAQDAIVTFTKSKLEQAWTKPQGTLLEFAEAHGLAPEFGCRNGICGACKVKVQKGKVTHDGVNSYPVAENEALLCCAVPVKTRDDDSPEVLVVEA